MYIWDVNLAVFRREREISDEIQSYYMKLQDKARETLQQVSEATFYPTIAALHGIEEKCRQLFYFLQHQDQGFFQNDEQMLACIDAEYKLSFSERLGQVRDGENSIVYAIDEEACRRTSLLWETDLTRTIDSKHISGQLCEHENYHQVSAYFTNLRQQGETLLRAINPTNFQFLYPKLQMVDAKCRMLLGSQRYFLHSSEDQPAFLRMIEEEFHMAHLELFQEEQEAFDHLLLFHQIDTNKLFAFV